MKSTLPSAGLLFQSAGLSQFSFVSVTEKDGMGGGRMKNAYQTSIMCSYSLQGAGGGGRGWLAVLGRGKRSKCVVEGEEEGLKLLFMSCEQRAHLGPYVNPQQASAH